MGGRSVAGDPGYAPSQAGLATCYGGRASLVGFLTAPEIAFVRAKARAAAQRALELNPNLADARIIGGQRAVRQDGRRSLGRSIPLRWKLP